MVQTRNQIRKQSEVTDNICNITCFVKKRKFDEIDEEIGKTKEPQEENVEEEDIEYTKDEETEEDGDSEETEGECSEIDDEEEYTEYESENESEEHNQGEMEKQMLQDLIKKSVNKVMKDMKDMKEKKTENTEYDTFRDIVESIYDGDFFDRVPLEDQKKKLKETYTEDEISKMTRELESIKDMYYNKSPSVIDILKMNVSVEQKQKLLERIHCLANSDMLTHEYVSNLKYLTTSISGEQNSELKSLEDDILKRVVNNSTDDSYRSKILKSDMSFDNKVIAYKKMEVMQSYEETDTSEYAKYKSWMDSLLSVPFGKYTYTDTSTFEKKKMYIKNVRDVLDKKISFLEKPKDQIINLVTQTIRNSDSSVKAIGLHGAAGVGKTKLFQSIAEALGRPYQMISLGGESDASMLTGHNFTYVGSCCGRIIDSLVHTKTMNPVILFDELDKLSETQHGKEIIGTLIHLTDSTTNSKYNHDKYFGGIDFDLSKVLFVFTYNDPDKIDKILADRLFKIKVDNYNFSEKLEITNKHLIQDMLEKYNFQNNEITFTEDAISYLVKGSKAAGMRDIKTKIEIIFSRINTLILTDISDNIVKLKYKQLYSYYNTLPVTILKEHIDILLNESISESTGSEPPFHMYI